MLDSLETGHLASLGGKEHDCPVTPRLVALKRRQKRPPRGSIRQTRPAEIEDNPIFPDVKTSLLGEGETVGSSIGEMRIEMKLAKPFTVVGLGALLLVAVSPSAIALETEDGSASITWPGYDTNFLNGSTPVPNAEPVVVQVDFREAFSGQLLSYLEFPGLPNPAYWGDQEDAFLTASGQCVYSTTNTVVAVLTTVPAINYELYKCYFFDGSSDDVGFGLYGGPPVTGITSVTVVFPPGSIVQVMKETLAFGVDAGYRSAEAGGDILFRNFSILTPATEPDTTPAPETTSSPDPGPQPTRALAKTGTSAARLLPASVAAAAALVAAGTLVSIFRRRGAQM